MELVLAPAGGRIKLLLLADSRAPSYWSDRVSVALRRMHPYHVIETRIARLEYGSLAFLRVLARRSRMG